ncbi:hypothetical protein BH23PLA1_BH23PLA1_39630 [soil metagenome]
MTPEQSFEVLKLLVSVTGLWLLLFWLYRDYRIVKWTPKSRPQNPIS